MYFLREPHAMTSRKYVGSDELHAKCLQFHNGLVGYPIVQVGCAHRVECV